jgi:oxygen-independent coproporphyrinogen-3 oxidase
MAGIYIHVPFCKSRCVYCGFFSTTALSQRRVYVDAVVKELRRRCAALSGQSVSSIYFGGGTPSLLHSQELEKILFSIYNIYNVEDDAEITLEGNPDDLTPDYLAQLHRIGVNRLSMGVQTFSDARLCFLHRRHTAAQAVTAVRDAQRVGFDNLSIDLMFGFSGQTDAEWQADVDQALSLGVQHISAYSLMYEGGTPLTAMLERGDITEVSDEESVRMYEHLIDRLGQAGFLHYEISNFSLPGYESRHNSSYWCGMPYLGVGAGAHSYDGHNRSFNVESLAGYLAGEPPVQEALTFYERYNEYVFTGLRTVNGIRVSRLQDLFGSELLAYCLRNAQIHLQNGLLVLEGDVLCLTRQGLFVSNDVMSDLMWVD